MLGTIPSWLGARSWRLPPRSSSPLPFPGDLLRPPHNARRFRIGLCVASTPCIGFWPRLKLAVFSLSSLAASLAFATWFESSYGTTAAQDYVYKSTWFAVLLAFLAVNILCAALIRFPWKKRQTGFVITHAGLLDPDRWIILEHADRR